uniref:MATH domain-containing protein n=1 Tax=Strongyloides venezuelensis TaxID=75913 RepID=A0A0K0FPC5_STRVS
MKIETAHGDDYLGLKFFRFTFSLAEIKVKRDLENTVIRLKVNLIEQKASSITDDVKAQEKEDEELLDSLFGNKNESSSTKIVEEVVGEITDSDDE